MKLRIRPYFEYNGAMTLPDSEMVVIGDKILAERNNDDVFLDSPLKDGEDFLKVFKRNKYRLSYVMDDENGVHMAIFWLENFRGTSAEMGFAIINKAMQLRVFEAGKQALEYIFTMDKDGEPAINTVWGISHEGNKKAIRFLEAIGLSRLGTMPHALFDYREGKSVGGVILYKVNTRLEE